MRGLLKGLVVTEDGSAGNLDRFQLGQPSGHGDNLINSS
jgi:hypothetical protein